MKGSHLWLSLTSDSPRQSPNTISFNIRTVVQYSYPVLETNVGELLIYTRHFTVLKRSAWLGSTESPVSQAPNPVILKSATLSQSSLPSPSPYNPAHTQNTRVTKTLCSHITRRIIIHAGMYVYMPVFKKRLNFLNSVPTRIEGALRLLSAPSGRFWQQTAICPVSLWALLVELFVGLFRRTACACSHYSRCSSTTNAYSETGQMAVCCQNLPLGALCSRSGPSVQVGGLFKKFGLFLNTRRFRKMR
jgi:hypothetical protein